MKIILASQSPRRQKLLKKIISDFEIKPSHFDETKIQAKNPVEFAKKAAEAKVESVLQQIKDNEAIIIAADTIVVFRDKIIGKPKDDQDAFRILSELAGKEQSVITGFCLINTKTGKKIVDFEKSVVKMKLMPAKIIREYIATGEGRDKAGAYAVQGRADKFIEYIKGDYYNVVGFPVDKIKKALQKMLKC